MNKFMQNAWKICRWVWVVVIIAIAVSFVSAVLFGKPAEFLASAFYSIMIWLVTPGNLLGLAILAVIFFFIGLTIVSGIYRLQYGDNDTQQSQQNTDALIKEMKVLTQAHASNMQQLSDALSAMVELHEDNLAKISNSLQATSISLKILEQQVVLTPVEHLRQQVTLQNRQIDALVKQFEQESYQRQKQAVQQQTMIADLQKRTMQGYQNREASEPPTTKLQKQHSLHSV